MGAERLQADEVGAHVGLARLRVVPLGEEHPQPLGGMAPTAVAEDGEVGVQRQARADAPGIGPVVVHAADRRNAHRLAGHGDQALDEVPVAEAGAILVEATDRVEQGAAVGEGVHVHEVVASEGRQVAAVVAHGGQATGPDHELGGDAPPGVGAAVSASTTRAR